MRLVQLLSHINELQYGAAVYDELISHLDRLLEEDEEIPVDVEGGYVPSKYIKQIKASLCTKRDSLIEKMDITESVEVAGVRSEYFNIAGG